VKSAISFIIKIAFLLFLLLFISVSYFLLLISTEQKSLPFLTTKIESEINSYLGDNDDVTIQHIQIEQSKFNIIANLEDIKLTHGKFYIEIERVKLVFSIFDLILFQDDIASINIDQIDLKYHSYLPEEEKKEKFNINKIIDGLFHSPINLIKISNFNIDILKKKEIVHKIKINNIDLSNNDDKYNLLANIIYQKNEINSQTQCYQEKNDNICDFIFSKIDSNLIYNLHPKLSDLSGISALISSNFTIKSNENNNDISFILEANDGFINNQKLFTDKINFNNATIIGNYNLDQNYLENITANLNFENDINFSSNIKFRDKLSKYDIKLSLNNLSRQESPKLWPNFIPKDDNIKKWVLKHMKSFNILDSNISISVENGKMIDINAKFNFDNAAIIYDKSFPAIYNISGDAFFDMKSMKIAVQEGVVLSSKLRSSEIIIDNFHVKNPILKIKSQINGRAEDLLKYINYQSYFAKNIGNYVNGYARSYVNLSFPIKDELLMKDFDLKVTSDIKNLNNDYIDKKSRLKIDIAKNYDSDIFQAKIDLTNSKITFKPLSIFKDKDISSQLFFYLQKNNDLLILDKLNFKLSNQNLLTGSMIIDLNQKNINNINLIHPDFKLYYNSNILDSSRELKLHGKKLDLTKLQSILSFSNNDQKYNKNNMEIILNDMILNHGIILNDIDINLHCNEGVCINSFIQLKKDNKEIINIDFKPYPIKKITKITGKIFDVGAIAKGLDIYSQILDGDLVIRSQMEFQNNDVIISGEAYNKKDFVITKDDIFSQISQDDLFLKIKEKLDLSYQIIFEDLHSNFKIRNNILEIEKFIINNNYIGITAKGNIGILDGRINVDGLIIPSYLINRLFGIGDLPVIKYIAPILVGEDGGGVFAAKYKLQKNPKLDEKIRFILNKGSIFAPGAIRNFFN
jgi:hypothetical protein